MSKFTSKAFVRLTSGRNDSISNSNLAYFTVESVNKGKKVFPTLTTGVNVIKLFSSLLMMRPNKLECLHLAKTFQSSLTFAGNTRSLPEKEASERHSNWVSSVFALKL
jgi:hypothetical protein